jgi:hypothetical protein
VFLDVFIRGEDVNKVTVVAIHPKPSGYQGEPLEVDARMDDGIGLVVDD